MQLVYSGSLFLTKSRERINPVATRISTPIQIALPKSFLRIRWHHVYEYDGVRPPGRLSRIPTQLTKMGLECPGIWAGS